MSRVLLNGSIILVVASSGLLLSTRIFQLPATILFWTKMSLLTGAAGTLTALGFRRCLEKKRAEAIVVNLTSLQRAGLLASNQRICLTCHLQEYHHYR